MGMSVRVVSGLRPRPALNSQVRIAELWGQLEEADRVALLAALGDGLLDARWAVQEMTQPSSAGKPVGLVLASLGRAIQELSRARELLAERAEEAA